MEQPARTNSSKFSKMGAQRAVYFDEGPGFFLIKVLGEGLSGSACLVRSAHSGKLYVRKEELAAHRSRGSSRERAAEVRKSLLVEDVTGVTKLRGWVNYMDELGRMYTVTYWNYCNAGTLHGAIMKARSMRRDLPEIWVCDWFYSMLSVLLTIHRLGLAHEDGHQNNWFLHHCSHRSIPMITLGDFGNSTISGSRPGWERRCREDFEFAQENVNSMLDLTITRCGRLTHIYHARPFSNRMYSFAFTLHDALEADVCLNRLNVMLETVQEAIKDHHSYLQEHVGLPICTSLVKAYYPEKEFAELKDMIEDIDRNPRAFKQWYVGTFQHSDSREVYMSLRPEKYSNSFKQVASGDWTRTIGKTKYKAKWW